MPNFRIFTEGKGDIKFLKDYIEEVFNIFLNEEDFDPLGSWSGYKTGGNLKASIRQNTENDKINILILDADTDFEERKKEVIRDFENYNTPLKLFLFPTNSVIGNLEDLLADIAVDRRLIECFTEYEKCVALYPKKLNHSRIYTYIDMLLVDNFKDEHGKDLRVESFRNYRNKDHWKLDHQALISLKEFLNPLLNKDEH